MIELNVELKSFFRERLDGALQRHRLNVDVLTEAYLVDLMARYAHAPISSTLARPLVERMAEALEAQGRERLVRFRELGDCALVACGFFSDHLVRRGVSRDYIVAMGGRAYGSAGDLAPHGEARVYPELAERFDPIARVLDDVRESTSLRTPQDIVRLYERWRRTGSPLLAERLREGGVFPVRPPNTTLH
ncbi:MAG: hypothetical protein AAGF12_41635 [Myxococcota bacterium]